MRISDWSSDVCSSDLLSLNGSTSSWLPLQRSMLMSRTRLPTVTFRIVLQDRQPSSNIATRPSTNEETGYENASPIPSRSEEHTSELQSLMRISYAVFCLKKKKHKKNQT